MTNRLLIAIIIFSGIFSSCQQTEVQEKTDNTNKINVGVFNGNGASAVCILETLEALKIDSGIQSYPISASEIIAGKLEETDVLIFPGGSGSKEMNNLGLLGAEKVKAFAKINGKGLVGICAGGYLLASTPNYPNLGILPITHIREHYNRGRGLISFSQNDKGNHYFPENKENDSLYIQYYDGPIYNITDTSSVEVLSIINTDIATHKDDPRGLTPGKAAFVKYKYEDGFVIACTGHPESTHGMRWMVPRMARMAANRDFISYPKSVVKPNAYSSELLFFSEDKQFEKTLFWDLSSDDAKVVIEALDGLKNLHSRPSIRWTIGLLRHTNTEVRLKAAEYLVYTEYTFALADLKQTYYNEKDEFAKKKLQDYHQQLLEMINKN